jgi:hypothetical protein
VSDFFVCALPAIKEQQLKMVNTKNLESNRIRQLYQLVLEDSDYPINFLLTRESSKFLIKYLPYDNQSKNG